MAQTIKPIETGADILASSGFARLKGLNVGLIVNHTSLVHGDHLVDLIEASSDVLLGAIFTPEHGLCGSEEAGAPVSGGRHERSGAPIFSLYGDSKKPTPEMLEGLDILVFDMQDVGARFYTYISTMGLAMSAARAAQIPFLVLDRPNPLGGEYVSGPIVEPEHICFVGQYPIPIAHGLTVGELAFMIREKNWLADTNALDLQVEKMRGWRRDMSAPDTGLPWIAPSPNLPDYETALVYAGTCLFEATSVSEGRGTKTPFFSLGAPWLIAEGIALELNEGVLPGVAFEPVTFIPRSMAGFAAKPKYQDEECRGVRLRLTDHKVFQSVETGIHCLHAFYHQAFEHGQNDIIDNPKWLAKLSGASWLYEMLCANASAEDIIDRWGNDVASFQKERLAHLLY